MSASLPARKRLVLLSHLRNGADVAAAAREAGLNVRQVFTAARTDTALALALAGTDPDELGAAGIIARADYLRLLALGCTPSLAAQILFDGAGTAGHWRRNKVFASACEAVKDLSSAAPAPARAPRFTPERRHDFLARLEKGMAVTAAAAETGITTAVVYQRRRRDSAFASAMDHALQAAPRPTSKTPAVSEEQWVVFFTVLRAGVALRQAALAAGIRPETVYERRRTDTAFARRTDQARGVR
ncbi:hypothetical protein [Streptomyces sp. NBC_01565]|uniref:hypothetical protein n=1 Tax=Streptomyces sp. NBC_01565 TaxID=2975881 RepID=UPI00224FE2B4|nr:hypothetical protein [Streptomyces sp. NBC_01565]MCX4546447.1 hypothetical protein [Streptomyces sp. NBC_01565]